MRASDGQPSRTRGPVVRQMPVGMALGNLVAELGRLRFSLAPHLQALVAIDTNRPIMDAAWLLICSPVFDGMGATASLFHNGGTTH